MKKLHSPGDWTETDFERQEAASGVLKSWTYLSESDRNGLAGDSLLNAARGLLSSKDALQAFEQEGFELSIDLDDPEALRRFLQKGARIPERALPLASDVMAYEKCWDEGLSLWCVRNNRIRCLEALADMGELERERLDSLPYLKEPAPSPLAQVDNAFLNQHLRPELRDESDPGNELILALMRGMEQQGLECSLSITRSSLARANPLFALLWRASDGNAAERPMPLLERLAFESKLFDPSLQSHQDAMLNLVSQGSLGAMALALKAGLSPSAVSGSSERALAGALCRAAKPSSEPADPWSSLAPAFFKPWIEAAPPSPSPSERMMDWLEGELVRHDERGGRELATLKKLFSLWAAGESALGFASAPSPERVSRMLDALSEKTLELKEKSVESAPEDRSKRESKNGHIQRLEQAMALLAPFSAAPAAPSLRI